MTRRRTALLPTCILMLCAAGFLLPSAGVAGEHRIGLGAHYWETIDDIGDDFPEFDIDESGLTWVGSYQYLAGFTRFEFAAEYFEAGFLGESEWAVAPQVYVLFGRAFYAGVGVASTYSNFGDGDFSDPYFIGKAGIDMLLLPKIHLDINADYRFNQVDEIYDYDTDTITLGATLRFTIF